VDFILLLRLLLFTGACKEATSLHYFSSATQEIDLIAGQGMMIYILLKHKRGGEKNLEGVRMRNVMCRC
jgi:hypothetical protein